MNDEESVIASIQPTDKFIRKLAYFNSSLRNLDLINSNIQIIKKFAFALCFNLRTISFPSCLEKIGKGSFQNCLKLEKVIFDNNSQLREICSDAFLNCEKLEYFKFPPLLETIGHFAFLYCDRMTKFDLRGTNIQKVEWFTGYSDVIIYMPASILASSIIESELYKSIRPVDENKDVWNDEDKYTFCKGKIFNGSKVMKHVFIRQGVEIIENYCFGNSNLVSVTIPDSVIKISKNAFIECVKLEQVTFSKNSQLKKIESCAFQSCKLVKEIIFPKSLRIIGSHAFYECISLEKVVFPNDSQLETIHGSFGRTIIKALMLPSSIKKLKKMCFEMYWLESIYVNNDFYKSNREGTAIFSKDGCELVCVISTLHQFEIPNCVRVIKSHAFISSLISDRLIIPSSVEIIENSAFLFAKHSVIEFSEGSRLKFLGSNSLCYLDDLIINNDNFIKRKDGVVISLDPAGIVFVPKYLTDFKVDFNVEVIYSYAFSRTKIDSLYFPKSLKKIGCNAFCNSFLSSITFEEGTKLESIERGAFDDLKTKTLSNLKLPLIKDRLGAFSLCKTKTTEFPPNFNPSQICMLSTINFKAETIICPFSSLQSLARMMLFNDECNVSILKDL